MDARRVGQTARERTRDLSRPGRIMPRRSRSRTAELTPQGGRVQRERLLAICEPGLADKCLRQADGPPPRERGVPRLKLAPFGTSGANRPVPNPAAEAASRQGERIWRPLL